MTYNTYWETEEFEDLVARSIIGLYETKIKRSKKCPKIVRFNEDVLNGLRKIGCYFAPSDREFIQESDENGFALATQSIDIQNDGLPEKASVSLHPAKFGNADDDIFLVSYFMERLPALPKPYSSQVKGRYYRFMQITFANEQTEGFGTIIAIDKTGRLESCYIHQTNGVDSIGRGVHSKLKPFHPDQCGNYADYESIWASFCLQISQDRRYLWNVQAQDGIAKSTFGVYPEQIKSLFYARDLPQTTTGRKRPILHWVQSHQRRMKSGTEVDVDKFLRGTHEFVMDGTKFKITNPIKEIKLK